MLGGGMLACGLGKGTRLKKILQTVQNVRASPNENSLFSKKRSPFWEKAIALFFQQLIS
jgi:hypothetical protein